MKENKLSTNRNKEDERKILRFTEIKVVNVFLRTIGAMSGIAMFVLAAYFIANYSVVPVNFMVIPICVFSSVGMGFILIIFSLPEKLLIKHIPR